MSLLEDVRRALKPMIDEGIITDIEKSTSSAGYVPGQPPQQLKERFVAIIPAENADSFYTRIQQRIFEAGLLDRAYVGIQRKSGSART